MNRTLHALVRANDLDGLKALLSSDGIDIDEWDRHGLSALSYAVADPKIGLPIVQLLLDHGANIDQKVSTLWEHSTTIIARALAAGDPLKVEALVARGANIRYQRDNGYDALIDAVHGRDVERDSRLPALLELLIAKGAPLQGVSAYNESGLRVLSRIGRFDAVRLLLRAGADASQLKWTPLIEAVATGSLEDVASLLKSGPALEETDYWERTAWIVALQTGDISKARLLLQAGANVHARGRCGKPPLMYVIESHQPAMLSWLLELGQDPEQSEEYGPSPLMTSIQYTDVECFEILLKAGVDVDRRQGSNTALHNVSTAYFARRLLECGADPGQLSYEGHRLLLNYPGDPDDELIQGAAEEFQQDRDPRFGSANPELMEVPFWKRMIRSGVSAHKARITLESPSTYGGPVWCANRFGQSLTFLADGRAVQVGGEHEDGYDPDFCIYNDVLVHEPDGTIKIYGYPESVFPPTDSHTATLIEESIYLIGSIGYAGTRRPGFTPVYCLDTRTYEIRQISARGEAPGWIYKHRADRISPFEIRVSGGMQVVLKGEAEDHIPNPGSFVLDLKSLTWHREAPPE